MVSKPVTNTILAISLDVAPTVAQQMLIFPIISHARVTVAMETQYEG